MTNEELIKYIDCSEKNWEESLTFLHQLPATKLFNIISYLEDLKNKGQKYQIIDIYCNIGNRVSVYVENKEDGITFFN